MSHILVTGASGFVGRRLVPILSARGYSVQPHSVTDGHIARCTFEPGASAVIHLAGLTFVPDSWQRPLDFYDVNVLGTANVLEYSRHNHASMTFISSYVYGHPSKLPVSEDAPLEAVNPYAHTKVLAEDLCRFYQKHYGVRVAIVRPFNLYGPGQPAHFLIPLLVKQAVSPDTIEFCVADAQPKRDFVHVDDLVAMLLRLAGQFHAGVYNAGSGTSHSIDEIVGMLNTITGSPKPLRDRGERRQNELMDVIADIRTAEIQLGWRPEIQLMDGLRQLVLEAQP